MQPLTFETGRGQLVMVRQVKPGDTSLLSQLLRRLSDHTHYFRYMSPRRFSPDILWSVATRMSSGHAPDHTALIATVRRNGREEAVAVAELVRDRQDPAMGGIALIVIHDMFS